MYIDVFPTTHFTSIKHSHTINLCGVYDVVRKILSLETLYFKKGCKNTTLFIKKYKIRNKKMV